MMNEILTHSGAVLHIDPTNERQNALLEVVTTALGGVVVVTELVSE